MHIDRRRFHRGFVHIHLLCLVLYVYMFIAVTVPLPVIATINPPCVE